MQDETRRGWRAAGLAALAIVWVYGCVILAVGGWSALGLFTVLIALGAAVLLRITRGGAHRS